MVTRGQVRFEDFYRGNYARVLSFVRYRLNDPEEAEDVTSEVFRLVWHRSAGGLPITVSWAITTARNLIGNEYRRRVRSAARLERAISRYDHSPEGNTDDHHELRDALSRLSVRDRELLFLTYWAGFSAHAIAEFSQCSVPAVWVGLSRARSALRSKLKEVEAGFVDEP